MAGKKELEKLRNFMEKAQSRGEFEWLDIEDLINWMTNKKLEERNKEKELKELKYRIKRAHGDLVVLEDLIDIYYDKSIKRENGEEDES